MGSIDLRTGQGLELSSVVDVEGFLEVARAAPELRRHAGEEALGAAKTPQDVLEALGLADGPVGTSVAFTGFDLASGRARILISGERSTSDPEAFAAELIVPVRPEVRPWFAAAAKGNGWLPL